MRSNWCHLLTLVQLLALLAPVTPADKLLGIHVNQTNLSNKGVNKVILQLDTSHLRQPDKGDCVELRTKRFISDGSCNSARPVVDIICTDTCYMLRSLPDALEPKVTFEEWQCKKSATRRHKVKLICKDGSRRFYFVRLVKKCTCEKKQLSTRGKQLSKQEQQMLRRFEGRIKLS